MKEMIKKYSGTLIYSVLIMLAGVLVGFTCTQSMWANVFFVVMDCVLIAITFYDNRNRQQSHKVIGMIIWIIPIITLLYNGIARLVTMGADMENLFMAVIYGGTGLLFVTSCCIASPSNTAGIPPLPSIPAPTNRLISSRSPDSKNAVLIFGPPTIPMRSTPNSSARISVARTKSSYAQDLQSLAGKSRQAARYNGCKAVVTSLAKVFNFTFPFLLSLLT